MALTAARWHFYYYMDQPDCGNDRSECKALINKTLIDNEVYLLHPAILALLLCLQESQCAPYWFFHHSDFPGNTSPPSRLIYLLIALKGACIIHGE